MTVRIGDKLKTFNSLSRDHRLPHAPNSEAEIATFQLPLSGSREFEASGIDLFSTVAFNSLSRDHLRHFETSGGMRMVALSTPSLGITGHPTRTEAGRGGFQLPLSGSRFVPGDAGVDMGRVDFQLPLSGSPRSS